MNKKRLNATTNALTIEKTEVAPIHEARNGRIIDIIKKKNLTYFKN